MNVGNLINQLLGSDNSSPSKASPLGGLAGGALAGGAAALLLGNKTTRKIAGNVATVGGMALIGTVAYNAYQNWQSKKSVSHINPELHSAKELPDSFLPSDHNSQLSLRLTIVKAMIAAAKADGQIDSSEQERIFKEAQSKDLSGEEKAIIFDLLSKPVSIETLASSVSSLEQKTEVYLASYITCRGDSPEERAYLTSLSQSLGLPADLVDHLESQAKLAI